MTKQTPQNSETTATTDSVVVPEATLLSWSSHPAKSRPVTTILVLIFLLVLLVIVYVLTFSPFFTAAAGLILWGSLSQFFLSTTFELTDSRVRVKYVVNKVEKEWSQYRSYYPDKNGVLLSPFVRPSRLENFRGLFLRFNANRDQVMDIVRSKIQFTPDA